MSLDADMIVDRRRMRRKLTFWRVVAALIALVAVIGGAVLATQSGREAIGGGGSIAREDHRIDPLRQRSRCRAGAAG